jgi:hypothetical protein
MSVFVMPRTTQQEQFSIAYVHSIASAAGFGVERIQIDLDSVDVRIVQYGRENEYPIIESLNMQLKCTYTHIPQQDNHIHYPLKIKNYNDLRRRSMEPRILVVVHVPEQANYWLVHLNESLALYHCAYWMCLRGMPETANTETVTVKIPIQNRFTVDELRRIMEMLAQGKSELC